MEWQWTPLAQLESAGHPVLSTTFPLFLFFSFFFLLLFSLFLFLLFLFFSSELVLLSLFSTECSPETIDNNFVMAELRRPSGVSMEQGVSTTQADRTLEDMGYKPELARNRSIWQVTFMCFILSSVPYGLSTTIYYPIAAGGPSNVIWGWVIISFLILCVAISLAEITSVYPTAGGVYYQTFVLSPAWCRRVASWICGWSYVAGNITITLAVNFGTALLFVACLNVFEDADGVGITENFGAWQTFLIFLAITLLTHSISAFGNKWLPWLEVRIARARCPNGVIPLTINRRPSPSSGPWRECWPSSCVSWRSRSTAVIMRPGSLATLKPRRAGRPAGPFSLVSCTPPTPHQRPA